MGISVEDARSLAVDVESAWHEYAEDPVNCYIDAERKRTFTMIMREAIGTHTQSGEITSAAEWISRSGTPFKTAIKVVSPHRISNPNKTPDAGNLKSGVVQDRHGAAIGYWVRAHDTQGAFGDGLGNSWKYVKREMRSGRQQFIHVFEPSGDGQTRGANKFLSVMEQLQSLSTLQNTKLQQAIVSAMYAAVIESEYDDDSVFDALGNYNPEEENGDLQNMLMAAADYHEGANIKMNGVRIPRLMPNERFNFITSSNSDNGFSDLEAAILRYIAAGTGPSYEQLAKDYSKTNYSSARASMMESWRYFMGRRKVIASRYASMIFTLWFEEAVNRKIIKLPGKALRGFYEAKASWCNAEWIGSGRLAIDGLKEVKEAVLLIESGLSTYEKELAKMGEDYQEVFAQQVREINERKEQGLPPPSWMALQALAPDQDAEQVAVA